MILSFHSFLRGTGKSNLVANVATLLAVSGRRVGVIDTAFSAPSLHYRFAVADEELGCSLNSYLGGCCTIQDTVLDVTKRLRREVAGKVFLIPAAMDPGEITRLLREGYDLDLLHEGLKRLVVGHKLDVLVLDNEAGLNAATLSLMALADAVAVVTSLDKQDHQGVGVMVDVARSLNVLRLVLVVNMVSPTLDLAEVRAKAEQAYKCEIAGVLPHSEEMMTIASAGVFSLAFPTHPLTILMRQLADRLVE